MATPAARFPIDEEPKSPATPPSGGSADRSSPSLSPGTGLSFWQHLVVAAVSAGKDANAAMAMADAIVSKSQN